jgi:peptidoglycan/xylan/chitin deacetylase (PgdA/CDA1 family)
LHNGKNNLIFNSKNMDKIILKKFLLIIIPSFIIGFLAGYLFRYSQGGIVQPKENSRPTQESLSALGPMLVITYDDGPEKLYDQFFPVHKAKGAPATIFMISGMAGDKNMLTWAQLREMNTTGNFEIQDHTYLHPNLKNLSEDQLTAEFEKSIKTFSENGFQVNQLAYPWGFETDLVKKVAKNYYQSARLCLGIEKPYQPKDYSSIASNPYSIDAYYMDVLSMETIKSYVDKAVANKTLLVFVSHGFLPEEVGQLIDYAKEKDCEIVTYSEAIKRIFNRLP